MTTHDEVTIRTAEISDIEALLRLRGVMFKAMNANAASEQWEGACRQILLDGLTSGDLIAAVAVTNDGSIVASGVAAVHRWLPSPANPSGLKGYIGSMATDRKRRRQGIGRRVADALVEALHHRGITEIELQATEDGEGIYRSLGFSSPPKRTPLMLSADADNPLD